MPHFSEFITTEQVFAREWLGDKPRTIILERASYVNRRTELEAMIDGQVDNWPSLHWVPRAKMFVVNDEGAWIRVVAKFYNENDFAALQCVDSSTVIDYQLWSDCRAIGDKKVEIFPWGRVKSYLYGCQLSRNVCEAMIAEFDFFLANREITAVMYNCPQKSNYLRQVYFCDFLREIDGKLCSFRQRLIDGGFANECYADSPVNQFLKNEVSKLISESNAQNIVMSNRMNMISNAPSIPIQLENIEIIHAATIEPLTVINVELAKKPLNMIDLQNLPDATTSIDVIEKIGSGSVRFI